MGIAAIFLILVVLAFAWSMGAHYTGACMGMPYASGSVRLRPALAIMAVLTFAGAALASHHVELTVGFNIVSDAQVTLAAAIIIVGTAFLLTTLFTYYKIPTSTIQILVFCVVGIALARHIAIHWTTIWHLAIIWVLAPLVASGLGFVFTRGIDLLVPAEQRIPAVARETSTGHPAAASGVLAETEVAVSATVSALPMVLVVVGAAASFTMGSNDVSNATGVFLMTHVFNVWTAGVIGGVGLSIGVLTWGKPLLRKVAFDIVHVDLSMATAAQLVQALVVLVAVSFGYFTSMNQALVGAMAGTGIARGRQTVQWPAIFGILRGWFIGPAAGLVLAFLFAKAIGVFTML